MARIQPHKEEMESDSDEEVSTEEEESDSEPEQPPTATQKKPQPQLPVKPQQPPPPSQNQLPSSSSEEEESDSESDSDTETGLHDPVDEPLASKRKEETQNSINGANKARSKPTAAGSVTPTKSTASKRPSEDTDTKNAKKSKKTAEPESSEKKSTLFSRFWSEDDEITILNGMIEFSAQYKSDPISDLNAFHDFVKEKLPRDFTKTQLQHKIKRLKQKYENNKIKEKKGKERNLAKHEKRAYDLSKELWGNEVTNAGSPKSNASAARKTPKKTNKVENGDVKDVVLVRCEGDKSLPRKKLNINSIGVNMEEKMLINGIEVYESGSGLEGGKDWKQMRVVEMELYLKQLELRVAQTKLVLNSMKGGDDH